MKRFAGWKFASIKGSLIMFGTLKFLVCFAGGLLFCGGARALPQDWRCEAIEVAEVSRATLSARF